MGLDETCSSRTVRLTESLWQYSLIRGTKSRAVWVGEDITVLLWRCPEYLPRRLMGSTELGCQPNLSCECQSLAHRPDLCERRSKVKSAPGHARIRRTTSLKPTPPPPPHPKLNFFPPSLSLYFCSKKKKLQIQLQEINTFQWINNASVS